LGKLGEREVVGGWLEEWWAFCDGGAEVYGPEGLRLAAGIVGGGVWKGGKGRGEANVYTCSAAMTGMS